mmetsp:Transcript_9777/g.27975  ORF Transcript_9777/g.27975 Transcript_9777/m.27975 type:complete len:584 (-) Transcript_9777:215-1966(-)
MAEPISGVEGGGSVCHPACPSPGAPAQGATQPPSAERETSTLSRPAFLAPVNRASREYGPLAEASVDAPPAGSTEQPASPREQREAGGGSSWQGEGQPAEEGLPEPVRSQGAEADPGPAGYNLLQTPLQKLWELERLEMARHREELRSIRGELRSSGPGEHTRYREEQAARQELQQVIRSLIRSSNPDDRFTLETLLRAIEAGHEDAVSSPMVQQYLAASRKRRSEQREGSCRSYQTAELVAKAGVLLLTASLALCWRRLRLGRRIQGGAAALARLFHGIWSYHLAKAMAPANRAAVGVHRLLSRTEPIPPPHLDYASASLSGCNARTQENRRVWYRPRTWFARRQALTVNTSTLNPLLQRPERPEPVHSPSPPWLFRTAPPRLSPGAAAAAGSSSNRPNSLDSVPLHSLQMPVHFALPGVHPPVPSAKITSSSSLDQNLHRHHLGSPPIHGTPAAHSMPTSPRRSFQSSGLPDNSPGCASTFRGPHGSALPAPTQTPPVPKADYLTAPTCSFKAWQARHAAEAALAAINREGGEETLQMVSCGLTVTGDGVSFRTTVQDAAELQASRASKDLPEPRDATALP